jgi:membrane-bound lytic murein transglycosylase F
MDLCTKLKIFPWLFIGVFVFISCNKSDPSPDRNITKNTDSNRFDTVRYTHTPGVLRVLVDNSLTSYLIYKGVPRGFEYEMLNWFARDHDLELEIKISTNLDHIIDTLAIRDYDIAAGNLNITRYRQELVNFTNPILRARQVLIQKLPDNYRQLTLDEINDALIRDPLDLNGDTVHVRKGSSFYSSLQNFMKETATNICIDTIPGMVATDSLIEMVAKGKISYTVADENRARTLKSFFGNIDINTPISLHRPIGWAVPKSADQLLDSLNSWIDTHRGSLDYNVIKNRYFNPNAAVKRNIRRGYKPAKEGKISNYDPLIRYYAERINWNWILLAAQIYKESNFNSNSKSWMGAIGLMQVLPSTAKQYSFQIHNLDDPSSNLLAGVRHLDYLHKYWVKSIPNADSLELIKFTLASYNVGQGHMEDARRLAEKYDLNPDIWYDNVEKMIINKSYPKYYTDEVVKYGYCRGTEPAEYVKDILYYYKLYREFVKYEQKSNSNNSRTTTSSP